MFPAGIKATDLLILQKLNDRDLVAFCLTSRAAQEFCDSNDYFWRDRTLIRTDIPIEILEQFKGDRTWGDYYIKDLRKILNMNPRSLNKTLAISARQGRLDHVILTLKLGANIHANAEKALNNASRYGHLDVVKYLIENGAKFYENKYATVKFAASRGHMDIIEYILSVTKNRRKVKHYAAISAYENNRPELVKILVESGVRQSTMNLLLYKALMSEDFEMSNFLIEHDVDIHGDIYGYAGLAYIHSAKNGNLDVLKYIDRFGMNEETRNTAMIRAIENVDLPMVKYLAAQGVRVDFREVLELTDNKKIINFLKSLEEKSFKKKSFKKKSFKKKSSKKKSRK